VPAALFFLSLQFSTIFYPRHVLTHCTFVTFVHARTTTLRPTTRNGVTRTQQQKPSCSSSHMPHRYAAFATDVVLKYYQRPDMVLFVAYGPMTNFYQALVERTILILRSSVHRPHTFSSSSPPHSCFALQQPSIKAFPLDLTLDHPMNGCYNHPSAEGIFHTIVSFSVALLVLNFVRVTPVLSLTKLSTYFAF
jgi:hypothetical protein